MTRSFICRNELGWWLSEFFEKKKMNSKLELLESSYQTKASHSLDVLNLHVINQISKKKEISKHPQRIDMCKRNEIFANLKRNVQLPMSPITVPSKICLDDSEVMCVSTSSQEERTSALTSEKQLFPLNLGRSQKQTVEFKTDKNSQNYDIKKEQKYEETNYMTTEAESINDFQIEFSKKKTRPDLGFQHCLYDKCTSDDKGNTLSAEYITEDNKVTFPLHCHASHLTKPSLFEMHNDLSSNVRKLDKSGKRDVSVQCNFEQEHKVVRYFF